jgi:Tfp pilus assembly protein PilO
MNYKIKSKEEVPMILENMSRIANKNNVRIEKLVPHPAIEVLLENDEGQYLSVPIFIAAKSSYHNFGRFLNQLEVDEIFLNIPSFKIERQGNESAFHTVELKLDAIIFEKKKD